MKMNFRVLSRAHRTYCNLGATLDLRAAQPLKAAMLRAIEKQQPLTLNASSVERLSTACVQLLIAIETALQDAGYSLVLDEPSEAFSEAFADLGLKPELQQWMNGAR